MIIDPAFVIYYSISIGNEKRKNFSKEAFFTENNGGCFEDEAGEMSGMQKNKGGFDEQK